MQVTQEVRCPNCGCQALRHILSDRLPQTLKCPNHEALQTECPACDYLMVMCTLNGAVVEGYAPGIAATASAKEYEPPTSPLRPELWSPTLPVRKSIQNAPALR
jgi:hypothetical protein